ncbi:hypothetical protein R1sor_012974 [Riccia sorocarpa]|uniref:FCP1 homology domain-containing protein n=1 Tax=Riccia sorocarpa TaxID=122646 RepID=A0ABD3I5B2_9MARC
MDRGDESPTAARSEAEELHVLDMEQDADPNDNLGHEDEADSGDEDGLEPIDMHHMVVHEHRTEHSGAWCIEVDKIFYPHIGNSVFKVKEEFYLFLKVNDKWSPEGVATFISEFSDDKDLCVVYCEDWKEKSITQYVLHSSKYDVRGMFRSQNDEFSGVSAKSLKFDMKKTASWVRKKLLISRFWDARSHMYNTGRLASQIVKRAFVVPRPRRIDAEDVFESLTKFEEERRSGKRKTTTPCTGNNKKKPRPVEAQFKSIVSQTMGWKSYKEVIPLVCCSDETYAAFEKFVKCWKEWKIPDVHGTIGRSKDPRTGQDADRDFSQLSVNSFRSINGLSDEDLKLAWTVLEEGKVWVTKPARYQGPEDDVYLKDFCKVLKATRDLEKRIVKYWNTSYKEQHGSWGHLARAYSISEKWLEKMLKFLPEKGDKEAVLEEASSSEEESNKNKKKAKKKTVEVLPSQITTAIHRIYTAKHGIAAPSRQEPLHILHLSSVCQYKLTLDEQFNCSLVFLDVTHPNLVLWGKPEFCSSMGIVKDLTVSIEFTIVSLGSRGIQAPSLPPPPPPLVENSDYRSHSFELRYKTWKEEFTLDKGVGSEAVNLKNKAPRWDFVGIEPAEGSKPFVHPGFKRRSFCSRLLNNFSSEGSTVLDFFSGGVFAREALLSSRDVIYFASSQLEAEFMAKYGKLLHTHSQRVKDWFAMYKKKHGHVEVEAPPQAEQSGAVTVAALATPFVPDDSVMANAIERLGKCPQISNQAMVEEDESNPQGDQSNPEVFEGGGSGLVQEFDWGASTTHNEHGASTTQNEQGASTAQNEQWASTAQESRITGAPQSGEEFPLANILSQARSVEANDVASPVQPSDRNDNSALALTDKSLCPAPDFMQMANALVKPMDLLPRKLLILDVEGLLLYAEGFMDKTSRTDCGEVISNGMKTVVRRNGVQALMSRCLELFDVALWSCCSRNTLWDYTHYLFSGEQYDKFLFMWDYNKALDTKEKWTRDNRHISLLLKPLKAVWERHPDFNARNTLLVDVNPYRASANPENTGIFPMPYLGSKSDTYLTSVLLPYLEGLSQAYDIREYVLEHALQGSQRPLHFRATNRGLPGLLHKFSAQAVETYVPPLLTKRKKLTDYEKDVLRRLPDIDELGDHECVAWARLLGLSWNQSLEDDLTTIGLSDENRARHTSTKASVKYARDFLLEVKSVNFA